MSTSTYAVGQRVELHPATDAWMAGDRYGEITKIGPKYLHVACDRSGKERCLLTWDIAKVVQP
jgi:hypothetical protein